MFCNPGTENVTLQRKIVASTGSECGTELHGQGQQKGERLRRRISFAVARVAVNQIEAAREYVQLQGLGMDSYDNETSLERHNN